MAVTQEEHLKELAKGYRFDWKDPSHTVFEPKRGLNERVVEEISALKSEPEWMRKYRLKSLRYFDMRPMPWWGADLSDIDFQNIYYFIRSTEKQAANWDELPRTSAAPGTSWASPGGAEVPRWRERAVRERGRLPQDQGRARPDGRAVHRHGQRVRDYPDLVREHFGTVIPANDNKFAALNSAVWSGGSFIYVPPGVHVDIPLQAYFRINAENMGQFERTLIIADEGSYVHYVEGCSAPIYTSDSLHSAVVEIIGDEGAAGAVHDDPELVDERLQPRHEARRRARGRRHGMGRRQHRLEGHDEVPVDLPGGQGCAWRGALRGLRRQGHAHRRRGKAIHAAPVHDERDHSKSVSKDGGRTGYRGLVRVEPDAHHAKSTVRCDALILDEESRSDTYPYIEVEEETAALGHEATVSKVGDDQLFYLMSRGLSEVEATAMIVNGFIEPITRELPMEYAVELNRLVELQMEGSVG